MERILGLNKTDGASIFRIDPIPFLSFPDFSLNTFSFYIYWTAVLLPCLIIHFSNYFRVFFCNQNPGSVLPLAKYLLKVLDEPNHWLTGPLESNRTGSFRDIKVILLNFCLGNGTNPELILTNQPTFSRGLNSRFRNDVKSGDSLCQYASQQCKADWYNPPVWEVWPRQLVSFFKIIY